MLCVFRILSYNHKRLGQSMPSGLFMGIMVRVCLCQSIRTL